jgi:predicted O-linked N-acetylglucosamine transferase (SPINDLY family)
VLARCAEVYAASFHPTDGAVAAAPLPAMPPLKGRRLRIGYLSGEFQDQATMVLMAGVLEQHDRSRFEIIGVDNGDADGSALRRRVAAALDRRVPIAGLDDPRAAALIREHGVDVLVNLNGYFGRARNGVFALRAAPVQVNYLGFPGTLGAGWMDYLVADDIVIPPGEEAHYREAVVRLPGSYQANDGRRPIDAGPVSRAQAGLPEGAFVFCSFNNLYKLTPDVFDVWMGLLRRVPGSVLWLLLTAPEAQENLAREAAARGVDPARLVWAATLPHARHLARLRLADLMLDTLPYNAHTTGSDALWAGLPMLTCRGASFAGRVGASLLHSVGLPELITPDLVAYAATAERLARHPAELQALRQRLAAARAQGALFDTVRQCRLLEQSFVTMAQRHADGLPPQGFQVTVGAPVTAAGTPLIQGGSSTGH